MRKNIALVDDDRNDVLTSVSMLLEAEGFQIKTYNDGLGTGGAETSRRPISASSTSRCRAWTGWSCSTAFARRSNSR